MVARLQPKALFERDLRMFIPLKAPVDSLKERSRAELEQLKKKKSASKLGREERKANKAKEGVSTEREVIKVSRPEMATEGEEVNP